ncbi:MAG: hypothetical protein WCF85_00060 [Rhodospirillaceae bacterium]
MRARTALILVGVLAGCQYPDVVSIDRNPVAYSRPAAAPPGVKPRPGTHSTVLTPAPVPTPGTRAPDLNTKPSSPDPLGQWGDVPTPNQPGATYMGARLAPLVVPVYTPPVYGSGGAGSGG